MISKLVYIGLAFLILAGCEKSSQQGKEKPLVVITSPDNPPFEFKDTAQGGDQVIGFDMDVIQKLGQHLGRPIKVIEADFAAIIPSLQSGRADMAIASLTATEERRKSVDFSDPYYTCELALLVPETSPLTSEKGLEGQRLGVQLGSFPETVARQWVQTIIGLSLVSLNKVGELVQELKNGRLHAILVDEATAHRIASSIKGLKVIVLNSTGENLAIAFPKGSQLVGPANDALKSIKQDIQDLASKWMAP